jgi:hypothetical protein
MSAPRAMAGRARVGTCREGGQYHDWLPKSAVELVGQIDLRSTCYRLNWRELDFAGKHLRGFITSANESARSLIGSYSVAKYSRSELR